MQLVARSFLLTRQKSAKSHSSHGVHQGQAAWLWVPQHVCLDHKSVVKVKPYCAFPYTIVHHLFGDFSHPQIHSSARGCLVLLSFSSIAKKY